MREVEAIKRLKTFESEKYSQMKNSLDGTNSRLNTKKRLMSFKI